MQTSDPAVQIENWRFVDCPGEPRLKLAGTVLGHQWVPDGAFALTTRVLLIDQEKEQVKTRNTTYQLGESAMGDYGFFTRKQAIKALIELGMKYQIDIS